MSATDTRIRSLPTRVLRGAVPAVLALSLGACGEKPLPPPPPMRPVTFVTLQRSAPPAAQTLSGTVDSWKREELGFRVPGRVQHIVDPGVEIQGESFDEEGRRITEGSVIATLDDERYRIALAEAEATHRGAEAALSAATVELEVRIPEQLKEAQADLDLQQQERDRYTRMVAERTAGQEQLDRIIAALRAADARVAQVAAARIAQTSAVEMRRADVARAAEAVELAKVNVRDCTLVSPFTGQVARVHTLPGAYAYRGVPAVTVQMMDPIKVLVAVSSRIDDQVSYNDLLPVRVAGVDQPLEGLVYLKDTFADPSTRTFLITLLVRNRLVDVGVSAELLARGLPHTDRVWQLQAADPAADGPWGVEVSALHEDDQGHFVWKAENVTIDDRLGGGIDPVLRVRKVRVQASESRLSILRLFTFRMLDDLGGLDPARDVIVGRISGDVEDGGEVLLRRQRWMLRPGDLARVELTRRGTAAGFFVPERAVRSDGSSATVCVARLVDGGGHQVELVKVEVGEVSAGMQRIEPVDVGALEVGAKVIVEGAQYVVPGESVAPTQHDRVAR